MPNFVGTKLHLCILVFKWSYCCSDNLVCSCVKISNKYLVDFLLSDVDGCKILFGTPSCFLSYRVICYRNVAGR